MALHGARKQTKLFYCPKRSDLHVYTLLKFLSSLSFWYILPTVLFFLSSVKCAVLTHSQHSVCGSLWCPSRCLTHTHQFASVPCSFLLSLIPSHSDFPLVAAWFSFSHLVLRAFVVSKRCELETSGSLFPTSTPRATLLILLFSP